MTATTPAAGKIGATILTLLTAGEMTTTALSDALGIEKAATGTVLNYLKNTGRVVKTREHKTGRKGHPATWALTPPTRTP